MKREPFRLGTSTVPDGRRGPWAIETFTVTKQDELRTLMEAIGARNALLTVPAGTYKRLVHAERGVVMSNTRMEVVTNSEAFKAATGRVLINGLGMGMLLEAILSKPDVTYVRVIEHDPDVIALVGPHFARDRRVEIIHADAYEYVPERGERFNYAWHDIWDTISPRNLPLMARLGRRYGKRRCDAQGFWAREWIRSDLRRR